MLSTVNVVQFSMGALDKHIMIPTTWTDAWSVWQKGDLRNPNNCGRVVQRALEEFGSLDGVVNSAATSMRGSLLDTSVQAFDEIFALNVRAPFLICQVRAGRNPMVMERASRVTCPVGRPEGCGGKHDKLASHRRP